MMMMTMVMVMMTMVMMMIDLYNTLHHNQEKGEWERVRSELIRRREAAEKAQEELEVKTHIFIFLFGAPIDTNLTN